MKFSIYRVRETIVKEYGSFYYEVFYTSGIVRYYNTKSGIYMLPKTVKDFIKSSSKFTKTEDTWKTSYIYE